MIIRNITDTIKAFNNPTFYIHEIPLLADSDKNQENVRHSRPLDILPSGLKMGTGSNIQMNCDDFLDWSENEKWLEYIGDTLSAGAKLTVYSNGVHRKAKDPIRNLQAKGLSIYTKCHINSERSVLVSSQRSLLNSGPKQLWYEGLHIGDSGWNCIFTNHPSDEAINCAESHFDKARQMGRIYDLKS